MNMVAKDKLIIVVLAVAIAVVAAGVLLSTQGGGNGGGHGDDPTPEPEPVPVYPDGISFDPETGVLSSEDSVQWLVTDELFPYIERSATLYEGKTVELDTGYYSVKVGSDEFTVIVPGKTSKTLKWDFHMDGEVYESQVTYEVDIGELAEITSENREWNRVSHKFTDLPQIVYVNDTVRSIESQLSTRYAEIGSLDDRQGYADFIVSFAQKCIQYPQRGGPNNAPDYNYWGLDEYWGNTLETLYYAVGDCEDSSAVACALFMAAGYKAAMVGVPGHVTAGVHLDSFTERDLDEVKKYNSITSSLTVAMGTSVADPSDETVYYGVDTIKGQVPVGYMLKGSVESFGKPTLLWGTSGFYPVA